MGVRGWLTVIVASFAMFMASLDNLIVTVALPSIRTSLGASLESLEWTVNAFTLAFGVFLIPAAVLADRFGRRRFFALGLGIFTAASALAAVAGSVDLLVAARLVQGLGGAIIAPLSLTLLSAGVPRAKRGLALGIWSATSGLGVALGPLIGGAVVDAWGWQWIFWINVPVGIVLIPFALRVLRESHGPRERVDVPGFVLLTGGLFGIVLGLVRANAEGWASPLILGSLIGGGGLLLAFAWWETRTASPMVPLGLFRLRRFAVTNAVGFFMSFGVFGSVFLLTQLLQVQFQYGPFDAGLRMLVWTGTTLIVAPFAGPLAERFGPRPFMASGLGLLAVALAWIGLVSTVSMSWTLLIAPFVLGGAGMAFVFAPAASAVLAAVPPTETGRASGVNNAIREIGGVFGVAVLATVFAHNGSFASPQAVLDGTVPAVLAGSVVVAVGAVIALFHGPPVRRPQVAEPRTEPEPALVG